MLCRIVGDSQATYFVEHVLGMFQFYQSFTGLNLSETTMNHRTVARVYDYSGIPSLFSCRKFIITSWALVKLKLKYT